MDRRITGVIVYMVLGAALLLLAGCEDLLFLSQLEEIAGKGAGVPVIVYNDRELRDGDTFRHDWVTNGMGTAYYYFRLENRGVKTLSVTNAGIDGTGDYQLSLGYPLEIQPGGWTDFTVTLYTTMGAGFKTGRIWIESSAPEGSMVVTITGQVVGPIGDLGSIGGNATDMIVRNDMVYISVYDGTSGALRCVDTQDKYTFGLYPSNEINLGQIRPFALASAGRYAYVGGGDTGGSVINFFILNLDNDPMNPMQSNHVFESMNITDLQVENGYLYRARGHLLEIFSIANPAAPAYRGLYTADEGAVISAIQPNGNFVYLMINSVPSPDPFANLIRAVNVQNIGSPVSGGIADITSPGTALGMYPESLVVFNQISPVVQTFDVSNPGNPVDKGILTSEYGYAALYAKPYLYVAINSGIIIYEVKDYGGIYERGRISLGVVTLFIKRSGDYLYVIDTSNLHVIRLPQS